MKIIINEKQAKLLAGSVDRLLEESKSSMLDAMTGDDEALIGESYKGMCEWLRLKHDLLKGIDEELQKKKEKPTPKAKKKADFKDFEYGGMPIPSRDGGVVKIGAYKASMKVEDGYKGNTNIVVKVTDGVERKFKYEDSDKFAVCDRIGVFIVRGEGMGKPTKADIRNYNSFRNQLITDVTSLVGGAS